MHIYIYIYIYDVRNINKDNEKESTTKVITNKIVNEIGNECNNVQCNHSNKYIYTGTDSQNDVEVKEYYDRKNKETKSVGKTEPTINILDSIDNVIT